MCYFTIFLDINNNEIIINGSLGAKINSFQLLMQRLLLTTSNHTFQVRKPRVESKLDYIVSRQWKLEREGERDGKIEEEK